MVVWQRGTTRLVAGQQRLQRGIKRVLQGRVVGSMNSPASSSSARMARWCRRWGAILAQCVNRADEALAEARATMEEVMLGIASGHYRR